MGDMLAVRFGRDTLAAVRHFARRDGVTISQWIRKLVDKELKNRERQTAVDVSLYPQTQTVASGVCRLKFDPASPSPGSVTF
jgi:hypothetical protein